MLGEKKILLKKLFNLRLNIFIRYGGKMLNNKLWLIYENSFDSKIFLLF